MADKEIVEHKPCKHELPWSELSQLLSKVGYLFGDEDITQITLTKPRTLLIRTTRPIYATKEGK